LYRRAVSGGSLPEWSQTEQVRALIPAFAVVVAVVAAVADVSSAADLVLCALAAAPFVVWTYCPGVPLLALSLAVIVPAVAAQRSGQLEPLLFEVSLLAFVVARGRSVHPRGRCAQPARRARARGRGRDPGSLGYRRGHLDLGCRVPVAVRPRGRAAARQGELIAQLQATRRELAQQALLVERRRIARDVHDLRGAWAGCRDAPGHERAPRVAS